jgi:hypothetical protein
MAGSSLPVTWRRPELKFPLPCEVESAVQIGYGPLDAYGFHALEGLQCMVERRKGAETGVKAVTCVQGEAMWKTLDKGDWSKECLEAAAALVPAHAKGNYRELMTLDKDACVYLVEYRDGFRGAVAMMNGWVGEGEGDSFCFAGKLKGEAKPRATQFYLQQPDPFAHFSQLLRAIDRMIQSGHAGYPIERTLLTTGILEAALISKAEKNRRVETPHLDVKYKPVDHPFGIGPMPKTFTR